MRTRGRTARLAQVGWAALGGDRAARLEECREPFFRSGAGWRADREIGDARRAHACRLDGPCLRVARRDEAAGDGDGIDCARPVSRTYERSVSTCETGSTIGIQPSPSRATRRSRNFCGEQPIQIGIGVAGSCSSPRSSISWKRPWNVTRGYVHSNLSTSICSSRRAPLV